MSVFDINELPVDENNKVAPNSDLDSDLSRARELQVAGEKTISIAPGDWVDIDPNAISPDDNWGFSFQVCGFDTVNNVDYVMALVFDSNEDEYIPTAFSLPLITNCFRRNPEIAE